MPADAAAGGTATASGTPSARDEAALFQELEAEILRAVAQPAADTLLRILAAPRGAAPSERGEENRAELLARLDLVEDVLEAVLLAGRAPSEDSERSQEPP